jgi:diadenosine tetraphosphate (Ap4A) HIT family hydrolase
MPNGGSPFLAVPASEWLAANRSAFVIADRFPVSPGHALVVSRRVIATWWEATDDERADILALVDEVKRRLDAELQPDGYNVGFNAGAAAGQTVGHLHIHVIPRYRGDVPDPRGGVRHVLPGKGNYLRPATGPYALVDGQDRLLRDDLLRCHRGAQRRLSGLGHGLCLPRPPRSGSRGIAAIARFGEPDYRRASSRSATGSGPTRRGLLRSGRACRVRLSGRFPGQAMKIL